MASTNAANADEFVIQESTPLSKSIIWGMIEDYYMTGGVEAWNKIPFYITSNPTIAEAYAELIVAFLRDYYRHFNLKHPLWIVEMASGTGCFSYYLIKEIIRKKKFFKELSNLNIHYLMTDFAANTAMSWKANPKLQPFVKEGFLKFGIFRPDEGDVIYQCPSNPSASPSKILLNQSMVKNPIISIANYFFDSLKQDAFKVCEGHLQEVLFSWGSKRNPDRDNKKLNFVELIKHESCRDIQPEYYENAHFNEILKQYKNGLMYGSVLFPVGPLKCLQNLLSLSNHNLVLFSSDKGFTKESSMYGLYEQPFVTHDGVFSYSVNYDAIGKYFMNQGGISLRTTYENLTISSSANYLLSKPCDLENSRYSFNEKMERCNLNEGLYNFLDFLVRDKPKNENSFLKETLSYICLSNVDPVVFSLCARFIRGAIDTRTEYQEKQLLEILQKVQENLYCSQQGYNIFYDAGSIYEKLENYDEAIASYQRSIDYFGESESTLYHMALCFENKNNFKVALDYYKKSLTFNQNGTYLFQAIGRITHKLANLLKAGH